MSTHWKPERYSDVSPYLIAAGAQQVIDFLKASLDAQELRRYDAAEGGILHAEVRVGDSVVMVADSADAWPPVKSHIHVYVPDVDAAFDATLRAGGRSVQTPQQREGDPDRRGGVEDPAGNTWWLATQL